MYSYTEILNDVYDSEGHQFRTSSGSSFSGDASWIHVVGTVSSSGDNIIIAAPSAGNRLIVCLIGCQLEGSTATTIIIKSGTNSHFRVRTVSDGDGLYLNLPAGQEWKLDEASALQFNLSTSSSIGYTIRYRVEAV